MSTFSDDHLAQFKAQSDRAFQEMQARADREMAHFLQIYGNTGALGVKPVSATSPVRSRAQPLRAPQGPPPQATPAPQRTPAPQQAPAPQNPRLAPAEVDPASSLFETATDMNFGSISKAQVADSVEDLKDDFSDLSRNLREESRAAAREAMKGTSDILKNSTFDLGKRAKEEAAALKAAARQAMDEERSLKAMKGRAAAEARKAKERMRKQAGEVKDDLVGSLQDMAKSKLDLFKEKAMDALETGESALKRELGDLSSGKDS
jgi:hypothetical protein